MQKNNKRKIIKSKKQYRIENNYKGFKISNEKWKPDRIDCNIDPKMLFNKYIRTRTPVILTGIIDEIYLTQQYWTVENMIEKAGDCEVEVEFRKSIKEDFGKG